MSCCEKKLKELIQIYEVRIGKTEEFLIDLDLRGRRNSIPYKINDKVSFLLQQVVKDLKHISDKIDYEDENRHERNSSRNTKKQTTSRG